MSENYITVKTSLGEYLIKVSPEIRYTESDEWVKISGNIALIGVTDYAQKKLREVINVELPEVGRYVRRGESIAVIESVKAVSDVYAPLSGKVLEVNNELSINPELINKDPYGSGWIVKIELTKPEEVQSLMTPEGYANKIRNSEQ